MSPVSPPFHSTDKTSVRRRVSRDLSRPHHHIWGVMGGSVGWGPLKTLPTSKPAPDIPKTELTDFPKVRREVEGATWRVMGKVGVYGGSGKRRWGWRRTGRKREWVE